MSATRHEVGADFVDLAQIGMLNPVADGHDARDVEFDPADVGDRDISLVEVGGRTRRAIADQLRPAASFTTGRT